MSRLEYLVAGALLRLVGLLVSLLPVVADRVVLASPRGTRLDGNLRYIERALAKLRPDLKPVVLVEPYGYGLRQKIAYFGRLLRGMYYLRTARLFVVDNAYLPIHVAAHRPQTTVVQVWHAASAVKRFGLDTLRPPTEPERTFLHRFYDNVIVSSEGARGPYAAALRTPIERVLAFGTPRTDFFFDAAELAAAREQVLAAHPSLAGRKVILYAPTFRGRGRHKRPGPVIDAPRLRASLSPEYALVLKTHPNVDSSGIATEGYDAIVDPSSEVNDVLALADILVTDYSSMIFEYALLRRPIIRLVDDLAEYARDPGLLLDPATEMIGQQVADTDGVSQAVRAGRFDLSGYDAFIERHLGACDGRASARFVEHFTADIRPASSPDARP